MSAAVAERAPVTHETEQKSFDINASVNLMRYDITHYGQVLPETRQRVCDEELTLIAEGINRPLYNSFTLKDIDGRLQYFHQGEWRSYVGSLYGARDIARREAEADFRREFLYEMADTDLAVGLQIEKLQPGEVLHWDSPFNFKVLKDFGHQFMADQGFQVDREMGFFYRAERNVDGSVRLETHSVDMSDPEAYAAAREAVKDTPNANMEAVVAVYDSVLTDRTGEQHLAGRRTDQAEEEACTFIKRYETVFNRYIDRIEELAKGNLFGETLERAKKCLTYGTWAFLKEESAKVIGQSDYKTSHQIASMHPAQIDMLTNQALKNASARYEVMSGCGGSIAGDSLLDMEASDVYDFIFGDKAKSSNNGPDGKGPLTFKCKNGHQNRRPLGKLIDNCSTCKVSVKC